MSIPSAKYLKKKAANRLENAPERKKIILTYSGIVAGSALLVQLIELLLSDQISKATGIQGIGTRSALSTASTVISVAQMLAVMGLALGYTASVLRIARGQYASVKSLKAGLERFWVLLRTRLLQALIFAAAAFMLCFLLLNLYMLTPFANGLIATLMPLTAAGTLTTDAILSVWDSMLGALLPFLIIYAVLLLALAWYYTCTYRMVDYLLIDRPQLGAIGAMRESRRMMRGNMKMMLRVDLSFWWYYLILVGISFCSSLVSLTSLGIYFLSPVLYYGLALVLPLVLSVVCDYFFHNKVSVTYALFYDSLCPKEEKNEAVLGNIFQM